VFPLRRLIATEGSTFPVVFVYVENERYVTCDRLVIHFVPKREGLFLLPVLDDSRQRIKREVDEV